MSVIIPVSKNVSIFAICIFIRVFLRVRLFPSPSAPSSFMGPRFLSSISCVRCLLPLPNVFSFFKKCNIIRMKRAWMAAVCASICVRENLHRKSIRNPMPSEYISDARHITLFALCAFLAQKSLQSCVMEWHKMGCVSFNTQTLTHTDPKHQKNTSLHPVHHLDGPSQTEMGIRRQQWLQKTDVREFIHSILMARIYYTNMDDTQLIRPFVRSFIRSFLWRVHVLFVRRT